MIWSPKALRSAGSSALVRLASNEDRFWSESLSRPHADSASGRARAAVRVNSFAIMPEGSFSRGEPRQRMVKISLESEMIVVLPLALPRRQAHLCCMFSILASIIGFRSEEHTSELQSLMRISYAVFCLKKEKTT